MSRLDKKTEDAKCIHKQPQKEYENIIKITNRTATASLDNAVEILKEKRESNHQGWSKVIKTQIQIS